MSLRIFFLLGKFGEHYIWYMTQPAPQRTVTFSRTFNNSARRVNALPTPLGSLCSHRLLFLGTALAYREIGSRDIAELATRLRAIEYRDPDSQWSTVNLGLSLLAIPKTCFSNLRAPNTRCHVRYSTQSPWDPSRLALSRFLRAPFSAEIAEVPKPRLYRISCHLSALKSTVSFKSRNHDS
jgi:hypothetical protein